MQYYVVFYYSSKQKADCPSANSFLHSLRPARQDPDVLVATRHGASLAVACADLKRGKRAGFCGEGGGCCGDGMQRPHLFFAL